MRSTGLRVYSLYGASLRPTAEMLAGLDTLVVDLQDVGARFYTYSTTMAYAMEAASENGLEIYVLDRPDPITAEAVQGPVLDPALTSFTGYMPMPVRHGMTMGELARMFNAEEQLSAKLHVVAMRYYGRREWFDQTGLRWIGPSPNLQRLAGVDLYPGVALLEGAALSVGRGTAEPLRAARRPLDRRQIPGGISGETLDTGGAFRPGGIHPRGQQLFRRGLPWDSDHGDRSRCTRYAAAGHRADRGDSSPLSREARPRHDAGNDRLSPRA